MESNVEEDEFNVWSSKLDKFFSQILFPLWNYQETVRGQVVKDKIEREEEERLQEIEKEAERLVGILSKVSLVFLLLRKSVPRILLRTSSTIKFCNKSFVVKNYSSSLT